MSTRKESPEAAVNKFFWTQPLDTAIRALAAGKLAIRHREEELRNAPKVKSSVAAAGGGAPVVKKSHHKQVKKLKPGPKPKAAKTAGGEVQSVQSIEPNSLFPGDGSQTDPPPSPLPRAS